MPAQVLRRCSVGGELMARATSSAMESQADELRRKMLLEMRWKRAARLYRRRMARAILTGMLWVLKARPSLVLTTFRTTQLLLRDGLTVKMS